MWSKIIRWIVRLQILFVFICYANNVHLLQSECENGSRKCDGGVDSSCGRAVGVHCNPGLTCRFHHRNSSIGRCKIPTASGCMVNSGFYRHGEKFSLDCRTFCVCQNGTYICTSKCPNEKIVPQGLCINPRLVEVPDRCCKEWICDPVTTPMTCSEKSTPWSECSAECGGGISRRISNENSSCRDRSEARLCQRTSCQDTGPFTTHLHHLRKRHSCKATQHWRGMYLRIGPCVSKRRYNPRHCGPCPQPDICCRPAKLTTVKIEMICNNLPHIDEEIEDIHEFFINIIDENKDIWVKGNTNFNKKHMHTINNNKITDFEMVHKKMRSNTTNLMLHDYMLHRLLADIYILRMEWVLKCECGRSLCKDIDEDEQNNSKKRNKYAILHRVHRE